jgi:FkbM family methyltransferase
LNWSPVLSSLVGVKDIIQGLLARGGYRLTKLPHRLAGTRRPIGDMACFLSDVAQRGFRPRSILDVGANEGVWTRKAFAVFPDASFLMIEPQHEMKPLLEAVSRDIHRARWVQAGAGAQAGELTLTIWEDLQGSSLLPGKEDHVGAERRTVPIVTIDSLYAGGTDFPDLVKLDIQGFELEALRGAQTLFGRTELFVLEVSLYEFMPRCPVVSEVVAFMAQRGYEVYDFPGFVRRPFDGALGQIDIAFSRVGGSLRSSTQWDPA